MKMMRLKTWLTLAVLFVAALCQYPTSSDAGKSVDVVYVHYMNELAATLWWFTAAPKPLKILFFWGGGGPQGSYSPYILGDTTRPGLVTCVLV